MDLDEVIGIEIQRVSLSEKLMSDARRERLLIGESQDSGFSLIRRFDPEAVRFRSIQTRMVRGGWASAMTIVPKVSGRPPAVFVLDEECRYLRFPGIRPEETDADDFEGPAYARIPLVSHLVGSGFAAAMATPKTLSKGPDTMTDRDWIALIKLFLGKTRIDQESLFLIATTEFTELALRLAVQFRFAGVVIEAPREMMFVQAAARAERRKQAAAGKASDQAGPSSVDDQEDSDEARKMDYFESETHMIFYAEHGRLINAPILVILAKEAPEFDQTRQTLLAALVAGKADFSAVLLDRWPRSLAASGEETDAWIRTQENSMLDPTAPNLAGMPARVRSPFRYDNDQFSRWVEQMNVFLASHSKIKAMALPLSQPQIPGSGPKGFETAFDQITGDQATGTDRFGYEEETDPSLPEQDSPY